MLIAALRRRLIGALERATLQTLAPALAAAVLGGCAAPAAPPALYQMRAAAPLPVQPVATQQVLQLLGPVGLPEALDRSSLLLPEGRAGLQVWSEHRWAEPLRDAVPRLLRQDLALLLGQDRVWAAPVPPGAGVTRHLRVDVLQMQATADRSAVQLQARWTLADPEGRQAPRVGLAQVLAPSAGPGADALAAAHRLALWRLAEQIAAAL